VRPCSIVTWTSGILFPFKKITTKGTKYHEEN